MVLRLILRAAATIRPATQPTRPPAIAAGIPSSKTANQAVAGLASKPMISPTMAPTTPTVAAPTVAHRSTRDQRRSSARIAFINPNCCTASHPDFASRADPTRPGPATRTDLRVIRAPRRGDGLVSSSSFVAEPATRPDCSFGPEAAANPNHGCGTSTPFPKLRSCQTVRLTDAQNVSTW